MQMSTANGSVCKICCRIEYAAISAGLVSRPAMKNVNSYNWYPNPIMQEEKIQKAVCAYISFKLYISKKSIKNYIIGLYTYIQHVYV